MTSDIARALTRAARQTDEWRRKRDALIVEAHREGIGIREIGRLAGLTHPTILNIIRRDEA